MNSFFLPFLVTRFLLIRGYFLTFVTKYKVGDSFLCRLQAGVQNQKKALITAAPCSLRNMPTSCQQTINNGFFSFGLFFKQC